MAIERFKAALEMSLAVYGLLLVVTTSGGKDSSVCVALAERAGIPFEVLHHHTTSDAPETVCFIREEFRCLETKGIKCTIEYPVYKGICVQLTGLEGESNKSKRSIAFGRSAGRNQERKAVKETVKMELG